MCDQSNDYCPIQHVYGTAWNYCSNQKFFRNCCSKGHRAFVPYTSNWPYSCAFLPNDMRLDNADTFNPSLYSQRTLVSYRDSANWATIDEGPKSSFQPYLHNLAAWTKVRTQDLRGDALQGQKTLQYNQMKRKAIR